MNQTVWKALILLPTVLSLEFSSVWVYLSVQFSHSVMSKLSLTPWTVACQASLSITNSQSLLKLMSIESVRPSNHLILCHPLPLLLSVFPSIRVFYNESVLPSGSQSIGASASVLPMTTQGWFPLALTGLVSLQSKGLSQESSPTPQFKSIISLKGICTGTRVLRWEFIFIQHFKSVLFCFLLLRNQI